MDVVLLSRLQFFLTICFHFIFVSINIGLSWLLVTIELFGWRKNSGVIYVGIANFLSRLFGITFVIGVATGIVMEFQIGMNWARFSGFAGDIFGTLLASEGLIAFFLESSFLGLYLFGRNKVPHGIHWLSILMVAIGSTVSAFWIISANSWQQTPAGFVIRGGRAELTSLWDAVFNPSTIPRFFHTIDASLIVASFFVAGIASYLLLENKKIDEAMKLIKITIITGLIFSVFQLFPFGHNHAIQVALTQPEKFAVYEAVYETQSHAPLIIFGIPTTTEPGIMWPVKIPGLLSLITFGDVSATIKGIKDFPPEDMPPRIIPFVSFHIMVTLGIYFIMVMLYGAVQLYRKRLWHKKIFLKLLFLSIPLPIVASELGWIAAEVGRQPWIIYKIMKTGDGASTAIPASNIASSVVLFILLYTLIGILYVYLIRREIKRWT